jgi:hypothetical protein
MRGAELSHDFYVDAVRPVLDVVLVNMGHAAALVGRGSEVLGFDDLMSRDHDWRARVNIFLPAGTGPGDIQKIGLEVSRRVPPSFHGVSTECTVDTFAHYVASQLNIDVTTPIHAADWITLQPHRLRALAASVVHHDDIGVSDGLLALSYYPKDVWLYLLAAAWWRLHPEFNLVGRTGYVGDDLGSAVLAAALVKQLMGLCFLVERTYPPYSKWLGSAFQQLTSSSRMYPHLQLCLRARSWKTRERALLRAYEVAARIQNELRLTDPVPTHIVRLWDRPFRVLWGDFPAALTAQISDPEVLRIQKISPSGLEMLTEAVPAGRDRIKRVLT